MDKLYAETIGRKVKSLWVSDDEAEIVFVFKDGGQATYLTEGDCCSHSWYADIVGAKQLIGATVKEIEELSLDNYNYDIRKNSQEDQAYGHSFKTDKGACDIIFRNASNGYYGGWAEYHKSAAPIDERTDLIQIKKDWRAE